MALFKRVNFSRCSIYLVFLAGLAALLSVALHRFELVGFQVALPGLIISVFFGLLAALSGIVGLLVAIRQRKSAMQALFGMLLGCTLAAPTILTFIAGSGLPRIHDISTDLENPPKFDAIRLQRDATDNDLDRRIPEDLAQLQQAAYPDLEPLLLERSKTVAFKQVQQLVKARGWHIVAVSADQGVVEATATTPIMAFKDDVVIRIQSKEKFTQVDMRSVSRVGVSDLGANSSRIKLFLHDLENFTEY